MNKDKGQTSYYAEEPCAKCGGQVTVNPDKTTCERCDMLATLAKACEIVCPELVVPGLANDPDPEFRKPKLKESISFLEGDKIPIIARTIVKLAAENGRLRTGLRMSLSGELDNTLTDIMMGIAKEADTVEGHMGADEAAEIINGTEGE